MTATLITGIGQLVTCDGSGPDGLGLRDDQAVIASDGVINWIGPAAAAPAADTMIDCAGRTVIPGFVDSHTHLVFAGDRSAEFTARMAGKPYDGGGIGTTVAATRSADDDQLRSLIAGRVAAARAQGTTTLEIKSGYGLTVEEEVRALRLAGEFTTETTFLGGHVVPAELAADRAGYVDLVCGPMLTAAAPYARWIDVFCEPNSPHAFTAEESRMILTAGAAAGLELRVHGNQLGPGPGVRLAVELGAASVDHCTHLTDADVDALAGAADTTVATLLPGVEFATRSPYPDGARLAAAGVSIALASDCNPGTCHSSSMPFMIALAVRELGLTPAQALLAATVGGARALRRTDIGAIAIGRRADLAVIDTPSYLHLAYSPGMALTMALDPDSRERQ
ncbi:imidazolonepropionase [Microlunatus parietis]|uniref:Imidazolonepropionase n=1 Tax=Microlunatus parietis TaxID=682979 RepID=A0A7Y9ICY8_9ACTN|nr:imidazolonepropionase [Microlunatus parietis]NYE74628.1 imidazolonepropionase [Microlunatus parietis]